MDKKEEKKEEVKEEKKESKVRKLIDDKEEKKEKEVRKAFILSIVIIFIIFFTGIIVNFIIDQLPKEESFERNNDIRHKFSDLRYEIKDDYKFGYYVEDIQYRFSLVEEKHECYIDIYKTKDVEEDYLQKEMKNDFNFKTITKNINGKTWYFSTLERKHNDDYYTENNYRIIYNKALYSVNFYNYIDEDERCKKDFEEFANSLKFE